jgi:hypothetical protein
LGVEDPCLPESLVLQHVIALKLTVTSDVKVGVIIGFFLLLGLLLLDLRFWLLR